MRNFKKFYDNQQKSVEERAARNIIMFKRETEKAPMNYEWAYKDHRILDTIKMARNLYPRGVQLAIRKFDNKSRLLSIEQFKIILNTTASGQLRLHISYPQTLLHHPSKWLIYDIVDKMEHAVLAQDSYSLQSILKNAIHLERARMTIFPSNNQKEFLNYIDHIMQKWPDNFEFLDKLAALQPDLKRKYDDVAQVLDLLLNYPQFKEFKAAVAKLKMTFGMYKNASELDDEDMISLM